MEQIHDHVFVQARQPQATTASTAEDKHALQYVMQNTGTQVVTVHVDFAESVNVRLLHLTTPSNNTEGRVLAFDIVLYPLERRVIATVVKHPDKRAFVRVDYTVKEAVVPSVEAMEGERERIEASTDDTIAHSSRVYAVLDRLILHYDQSGALHALPHSIAARICDELNRFSRKRGGQYADPSFPPVPSSLWGKEVPGTAWARSFAASCATWRHLSETTDDSWCFSRVNDTTGSANVRSQRWNGLMPGQESFACALGVVAHEMQKWKQRWFRTSLLAKTVGRISKTAVAQVSLCPSGKQWVPVVVDLFVPAVAVGRGVLGLWSMDGELYSVILQKAYAKLRGSYVGICSVPTVSVLRELTGSPVQLLYPGMWQQSELQAQVQRALHSQNIRNAHHHASPTADVLLVSFHSLDQHHCAFRLKDVRMDLAGGRTIVDLQDTMEILTTGLPAEVAKSVMRLEDGLRSIPWEVFTHLDPRLYIMRANLGNQSRSRRILRQPQRSRAVSSQLAISAASVSDVVVSCYCVRYDGRAQTSEVSLHRVESDLSWTQLRIPATTVESTIEGHSNHQELDFTVAAGEYIITVVRTREESLQDAGIGLKTWTKHTLQENITLLFMCLDQDMDGLLTHHEVTCFLQLIEHANIPDRSMVESFLARYASGLAEHSTREPGLTRDDLLDVYTALSKMETPSPTSVDSSALHELVWLDLRAVISASAGSVSDVIVSSDLYEVVCCVHTDNADIEVVALPHACQM